MSIVNVQKMLSIIFRFYRKQKQAENYNFHFLIAAAQLGISLWLPSWPWIVFLNFFTSRDFFWRLFHKFILYEIFGSVRIRFPIKKKKLRLFVNLNISSIGFKIEILIFHFHLLKEWIIGDSPFFSEFLSVHDIFDSLFCCRNVCDISSSSSETKHLLISSALRSIFKVYFNQVYFASTQYLLFYYFCDATLWFFYFFWDIKDVLIDLFLRDTKFIFSRQSTDKCTLACDQVLVMGHRNWMFSFNWRFQMA